MVRSWFSSRSRRLRIIGAALLLAAVAVGCSAVRFGYNQGPELAYWWLDSYVDFDDAQTPKAKAAIADWFAWHRRTQLPAYVQLLERARGELRDTATASQMCRWFDEIRVRTDLAFDRAVPGLVELVSALTPAQLEHIEHQYAKRNAEFRDEYLQPDLRERQRASVERAVERFERFYGRLDEPQRAVIAAQVAASPFDPQRWMAEREARQRDVLRTLRTLQAERAPPEQMQAALRALARRMEHSADAGYRAYRERLVHYNCAFAAQVHNATSAAQREAAARRLNGWEDDLRALAGIAPSAAGGRAATRPAVATR